MIFWLRSLIIGLRRHSSMLLDNCRLPQWFIRWWCKPSKSTIALMQYLSDVLPHYDDEVE
jgi:hypothetical protein